MSRPRTTHRTVAITLELVVEVSGLICPAEPDVGISDRYVEDLNVTRIGDELTTKNEDGSYRIKWCPDRPSGTTDWLEATILRQATDQLQEALLDANA